MASSKVLGHAEAANAKCTHCDHGNDAMFLCKDCNVEMCQQCIGAHLQSEPTQNHKVTSITEDKGTSMYDTKDKNTPMCDTKDKDTPMCDTKINCTIHQHETVQMFCFNCEVLVCQTCINGKHKHHRFDELADVTAKYMDMLHEHVTDLKEEIDELKSDLQSLEGNKKTYIKDADGVVDNINKNREEWKSRADTLADGLVQQVLDCKSHDLQQIDKQCKHMQDLVHEKENMLRSCEQSDNLDCVIKCVTYIQMNDKANPLPIYASSPTYFTEGMVDLTEIFGHLKTCQQTHTKKSASDQQDTDGMKEDFSKTADTSGKLSSIDKTVTGEFKPKERVVCVSTIGDKHAWLDDLGGYNVTLVDIDGNVIETLHSNIRICDMATTHGEVFITEASGHRMQKYNLRCKCFTIADMSPLYTQGLCITSDDELLVCLRLRSDDDKKVVRITMDGEVKQTIQYDQHNQPLYCYPVLVRENINGDICVVDGLNPSTVVVVNKDGEFRFRYPDSDKASKIIQRCYGIACDDLGFILVSDRYNNQIHLIDKDGQFIQYVLTKSHGIERPWGVDVDTAGKLWICGDNGKKVQVVKYRS